MSMFPGLAVAVTAVWIAVTGTVFGQDGVVFGDWQGQLKGGDGTRPLVAQVIPLADGRYKANLLPGFDTRDAAITVVDGHTEGEAVVFGTVGRIENGVFSGTLTGDRGGAFELKRVTRLSPMLGLAPPEGAVVLFDGGDLSQWENPKRPFGLLNLGQIFGGSERAAYMRCRVVMPAALAGRVELGSDDGVKVWVNGKVVHVNNTPRACAPGQDVFNVDLMQGTNEIMMKVVQGGGDWAGCLRLLRADGGLLAGTTVEPAPEDLAAKGFDRLDGPAKGYVLAWEVSGPYHREGWNGTQLFDDVLPPEEGGGDWKTAMASLPGDEARWRLVEDAMEIRRGGGSLVSAPQFGDAHIHIEFRTPLMPGASGQSRANSGVYIQGRYEVQILDSYGLEGRDNECGGVYKVSRPRVNMCAPPLQWQTYDITFRAARYDDQGHKTENARLVKVLHNGVVIHENVELPGPTGGGRPEQANAPNGPILLQDHGNPVRFRNIWVHPLD